MKIILNGSTREFEDGTTLKQLIDHEGLSGKRLAAEVNQQIITKTDHQNHILFENDTIEIVHAIGGG